MVFYTLVLQFFLKNGQKKKENDTFLRKKNRRKTIIISVDGKVTVFPMKLKLQRESFE